MTLVSTLGTLVAPYPFITAILMGIIGAIAIFIFGALRIGGPSAIFFVLVFAMTTGMPVNPELAPLRAGLVFLGGSLSWIIAMIGWLINPQGPVTSVVKRVYEELVEFVDSVGTGGFNESKDRVMSALKEAEETLAAGYIPWRKAELFNRLYALNNHANKIFLYMLKNFSANDSKIPREVGQSIWETMNLVDYKDKNKRVYKKTFQPEGMNEKTNKLFKKINDTESIMNEPISKINQEIRISKTSAKMIFGEAFDKNSIVFI